jgi:hypothetical protein
MEKLAAKLESQFLMPIPMSASRMASMSLAPSPTIPTLSVSSLSNLAHFDCDLFTLSISAFNLLITLALFYGETRAKTLIRLFIL